MRLPFRCTAVQIHILYLPYSLVICGHFNTVKLQIARIRIHWGFFCFGLGFFLHFSFSFALIIPKILLVFSRLLNFECLVSAPDWYHMLLQAFHSHANNTHFHQCVTECEYSSHCLSWLTCILCCGCFQSGYLWLQLPWAVCYSCCWLGFVGVSVVLIPAAATSAAGAALTRAAAQDTVSTNTGRIANFVLRVMRIFILNENCLLFAVYEAGKGIKTGTSTPQTPAYPPYFVTGVPAMVPIAPPSLVDKVSTVPPSDGSLLTAGKHLLLCREHLIRACSSCCIFIS